MDGFKDPGSTHEQIHEAGLKTVAAHFSTDQNSVSEKLNEAREIQFHKKCSNKSTKMGVNLASLAPSEDSVCLNLDRAYFQIVIVFLGYVCVLLALYNLFMKE